VGCSELEVMKEWGQVGDLYLPVEQNSPMGIAGGRKIARRLNMMFCMIRNMQFRMLKSEGLFTQNQNSLAFVSARVEETLKIVVDNIADYEVQSQLRLKKTQSITEAKFSDLTNVLLGETVKVEDLKEQARSAMNLVGVTQKKLIEDAQSKFIEIQGEMTDLQNKVQAESRAVGSVGGSVGGSSEFRRKSVLEFNIKDYPILGEEKKHFREWHYKFKSNLSAILGSENT
jgi:hypothetical protein